MAEKKNGEVVVGSERFMGSVVIEVGDDNNHNFVWPPTKAELRGRWQRGNLRSDELVEELAAMPDIPGMHVLIDGKARSLSIYDPLSRPEYGRLASEIFHLRKIWKDENVGPVTEVNIDGATNSQIKTWLYWAYRLLEGSPVDKSRRPHSGGPHARIVNGAIPELKEIVGFAGKIHTNQFESARKRRYFEDQLVEEEA